MYNDFDYRVASVDVGATPCSMHIPLNQFLSMLLTCFNNRHEMADECLALGYLQSPGDLLEIVENFPMAKKPKLALPSEYEDKA